MRLNNTHAFGHSVILCFFFSRAMRYSAIKKDMAPRLSGQTSTFKGHLMSFSLYPRIFFWHWEIKESLQIVSKASEPW